MFLDGPRLGNALDCPIAIRDFRQEFSHSQIRHWQSITNVIEDYCGPGEYPDEQMTEDVQQIQSFESAHLRFQKHTPAELALSPWCRLNPVMLQNVRDRNGKNRVTNIGSGPFDSLVTPTRILTGHP